MINFKYLLVLLALALSCGSVHAKKPENPGHSGQAHAAKAKNNKPAEKHGEDNISYFSSERAQRIRDYYVARRSSGSCPPGLARKGNGCLPPGQAKKWQRGHPLPTDVIYYDLPGALLNELGRTPTGQRIVRVGADLLLIDAGTRMVIDALEDLGDVF